MDGRTGELGGFARIGAKPSLPSLCFTNLRSRPSVSHYEVDSPPYYITAFLYTILFNLLYFLNYIEMKSDSFSSIEQYPSGHLAFFPYFFFSDLRIHQLSQLVFVTATGWTDLPGAVLRIREFCAPRGEYGP